MLDKYQKQQMLDFVNGKPSNSSAARSRAPVQARSQKRIDAAIAAAEKLLVQIGPERTSIPEIANVAEVPRTTIYQYFPDKYALFAHLAESRSEQISNYIADAISREDPDDWRELIKSGIEAATDFYNANDVARILLLTGPFGARDREAHAIKDEALSKVFRTRFAQGGHLADLPVNPDVMALAIEIAFACLKYGYVRGKTISPSICAEATRATVRYLEVWE